MSVQTTFFSALEERQRPDKGGVAMIKCCTHIYAPKGQTGQYATLAANPYRGCGHRCAYCYVPLITKTTARRVRRRRYPATTLSRSSATRCALAAGITEQVLASFTSDPYHPGVALRRLARA
jgi:DNA repair photolyase